MGCGNGARFLRLSPPLLSRRSVRADEMSHLDPTRRLLPRARDPAKQRRIETEKWKAKTHLCWQPTSPRDSCCACTVPGLLTGTRAWPTVTSNAAVSWLTDSSTQAEIGVALSRRLAAAFTVTAAGRKPLSPADKTLGPEIPVPESKSKMLTLPATTFLKLVRQLQKGSLGAAWGRSGTRSGYEDRRFQNLE